MNLSKFSRFKLNKRSEDYFHTKSRRFRKEALTQIKNKIRYDHALTGANFYTHDIILDNNCEEEVYNSWLDIYFLSRKDKFTFYNCTIEICQAALVDKAETLAIEESNKLLPDSEDKDSFDFVPDKINAWGKPTTYRLETIHHKYEVFDNMTKHDWIDKRIIEILQSKPKVHEEFKLSYDYYNGIGLTLTVDELGLTIKNVNYHINRFLNMGEINWKNPNPVDESRLIYKKDYYEELKVCGSNPLR